MDLLPFIFCESVAAALRSPSGIIQEPLSSPVWQKAIKANTDNRLDVQLDIGFAAGKWTYGLRCWRASPVYFSFEQLQKMKRKYLRIKNISIDRTSERNESSYQEIQRLVSFSVPYVSMASICVGVIIDFPEGTAHQLLASYRQSSIFLLWTLGDVEPVRDILKDFLQSDTLKKIELYSRHLQPEIEDFLVSKSFESIQSPYFSCKWTLFERLFATAKSGFFELACDFPFRYLGDFRRELQLFDPSIGVIQWKRKDGVVVKVERKIDFCPTISMEFSAAKSKNKARSAIYTAIL